MPYHTSSELYYMIKGAMVVVWKVRLIIKNKIISTYCNTEAGYPKNLWHMPL